MAAQEHGASGNGHNQNGHSQQGGIDWPTDGPGTPDPSLPTFDPVADSDPGVAETKLLHNYTVRGGNACWAAMVFLRGNLWNFRRMNRVADNSSGCNNVPAAEQQNIRQIQAQTKATIEAMQEAEARGDCRAVGFIAYQNTVSAGRSFNYKGHFMTRCDPSYMGQGGAPAPGSLGGGGRGGGGGSGGSKSSGSGQSANRPSPSGPALGGGGGVQPSSLSLPTQAEEPPPAETPATQEETAPDNP